MNPDLSNRRHSFSLQSPPRRKNRLFFHEKTETSQRPSQLQLFKEKLIQGLQKHRQLYSYTNKSNKSKDSKQTKYKSKHTSHDHIRTVLNFVTEQKDKKQTNKQEFQDKEFKKSQTFLINKRIAKKKEILALQSSEEFSVQFHKKRQIPIHHTQLHFNHHKTQLFHSPAHPSRTSKAIQDILRLQEELRKKNQQEKKKETDDDKQPLMIVTSKYVSYQSRFHDRPRIHIPRKRKSIKQEQGELGPWKRSNTADFESIF